MVPRNETLIFFSFFILLVSCGYADMGIRALIIKEVWPSSFIQCFHLHLSYTCHTYSSTTTFHQTVVYIRTKLIHLDLVANGMSVCKWTNDQVKYTKIQYILTVLGGVVAYSTFKCLKMMRFQYRTLLWLRDQCYFFWKYVWISKVLLDVPAAITSWVCVVSSLFLRGWKD